MDIKNGRYEELVNNVPFVHWYKDGILHREDGPAVEGKFGEKYWLKNGKLHREDGPAVTWPNGAQEWYLNDVALTEEDFKIRMPNTGEKMKRKATIQIESFQRIYFNVTSGIATPAVTQSLYASATEDPFSTLEEPFFEKESTFSDLLDLAIKGNTLSNGTVRPEDRKYLLDGFEALQKIITEKKKQVLSIPSFKEEKKIKFKP